MKKFILTAGLSLALGTISADFVVTGVEESPQLLSGDEASGLITSTGQLNVTATQFGSLGIGVFMVGGSNQTVKIDNGGQINTTADSSSAVSIFQELTSPDAAITNSGSLLAQGEFQAYGIFSSGSDTQITNSGSISAESTTGRAFGIFSSGSAAQITNSGSIRNGTILPDLQTLEAYGIFSSGSDAQITNSGSITVFAGALFSSDVAYGIFSSGSAAQITNSGSISAFAFNQALSSVAYGIYSEDSEAQITNSGSILAGLGGEAYGIYSSGSDAQITNSGTIEARNAGVVQAIRLEGSNPTLNLLFGSRIVGEVFSQDNLNVSVEKGLNLYLTLADGSPIFATIESADPYAVVGNNFHLATVDPTAIGMQSDMVMDIADTTLNDLYHSKDAYFRCCPGYCGPWIGGFGSDRTRDYDIDYANHQGGLLVGYDLNLCKGVLGPLFGASWGKGTLDNKTQTSELDAYFFGLSYSKMVNGYFVGLATLLGGVDYSNQRVIADNLAPGGLVTAYTSTSGLFFSPEITVGHSIFNCPYFSGIGTLTARYAGLYLGDYEEYKSDSNLNLIDRQVGLLKIRGELAFPINCREQCNFAAITPYIGGCGRFQLVGNDAMGTLITQFINFNTLIPENIAEFIVGIRTDNRVLGQSLYVNAQALIDNKNSTRFYGQVGLKF